VRVAAVEHPVLATDDDLAKRSFRARVVQRQIDVFKDAPELDLLVGRVAERLGREVAPRRGRARGRHPGEELIDQWSYVLVAKHLALGDGRAEHQAVGGVDRADPQQPLEAHGVAADRRLEEVAPKVREAADEPHALLAVVGPATLEDVVDAARVSLEIAAKAAEHAQNDLAGMLLDIHEQDRVAVDDGGEKVALLACLRTAVLGLGRLNQRAGRVRRDHLRVRGRIVPHRVDDRRAECIPGVLDVAAHGPTIQGHVLVGEFLLEPIVRRARPELRCDHTRDRRGVQQRARKQGLWAWRRQHRGLVTDRDLVLSHPLDQHGEATALVH